MREHLNAVVVAARAACLGRVQRRWRAYYEHLNARTPERLNAYRR
jgi:hypothetical protein